MGIELRSFRTKVGRRIFVLFVACVVVPILRLAWVSFSQASRQIHEQGRSRLAQDTKTVGMSIVERLMLLSAEMRALATSLGTGGSRPLQEPPRAFAERMRERFSGLALLTEDGKYLPVLGIEDIPVGLTHAEMQHVLAGKTLLRHRLRPDSLPAVYMYADFDTERPGRGILIAEINLAHLWQVAEARPSGTELYVLDRSKHVLFSTVSDEPHFEAGPLGSLQHGHSGFFEWHDRVGAYWAAYWGIHLEPTFLSPSWFVLLRQPRGEALAPMIEFRKAFGLIIGISLCAVLLLSFGQIRKNMTPVEVLKEATQRIAEGDFGHKVEVRSGDEFEALGKSFNDMSEKLKEGRTLLVRAAKLSTMGQMAAGVIHEVRQPLTAISGLLQLVMLNEHSPPTVKNLESALGAVHRLDGILNRFKSFSRMSGEKLESLALRRVVDQVYALMEHQFKTKGIRCSLHDEENLPAVLGDQQELQQVFSNLFINAVHAMEEKAEGERTLDVRLSSSGSKVLVEISDTGCGMSAEVMAHMFDPFFTTKGHDKGTGLGMAIVESILHKHKATIEAKSTVDVGTTFTLTFSAAPPDESPGAGRG